VSTYEDYADASDHYDSTRVPVGIEIILGNLALVPVPLDEVHLLDAGCGTGSFAATLAPHVGRLSLLDASAEMLAVAEAKLAATSGAVVDDTRTGTLQVLPFADGSFDAVMTNQVLHHLGDPTGDEWPEHRRVFAEYARVLRPGGVLVVNTTTHEQIRHGWWAFSLIPQAVEEMCRRYAPVEVLEALAESNGMEVTGRFVPTDATIQGDTYADPEGPLSASWRRGDSTWSLASEAELKAMIDTVTGLKERGDLDAYVAEHDARRPHIGQVTFMAARRPG
jgi:ubiquinone/menaquinone biosynthesis C-methylase UbiE